MSPGCRDWTERMIAQWSARAEQLQDDPGASASQLVRAACLEDIVRDLRARLEAAGPVVVLSADEALRARWEASLAAVQPYLHPTYGIMFNAGPIMDSLRWSLEDRLGLPRSAATGKARVRHKWEDAEVAAPANDPEPFAAGEQIGMFG